MSKKQRKKSVRKQRRKNYTLNAAVNRDTEPRVIETPKLKVGKKK